MLGYANAKISLVVDGESGVKVESKSQDSGRSQLLIADELEVGKIYKLMFEFSERMADLDGEGAAGCETLTLALRTWDKNKACDDGIEKSDSNYPIVTTPGSDAVQQTIRISKSQKNQAVTITGDEVVDMVVVVDYSGSFYRPDVDVILGEPKSKGDEEEQALAISATESTPQDVEFSRKDATVYFFRGIHSGKYTFRIRESFKKKKGSCQSAINLSI